MYVEQNPSETQIRRGIVTVTAENLPDQQLDIIQLPDITLVLSVDTLVMPIEGGQQAVTVVTNQAHLSARNQDSVHWCWTNVSGNQLIVNAEPNEGAPRSIVVNVTAGTGEAVKTVPLVVKQEGLTSDRDILMALYEATGGENWTNHENWGSDLPLSEWYGVTTEMIEPQTKAGEAVERVVELNLGENNLTGELPAALGGLTELRYLNFFKNFDLTGVLPAELGNLRKLERLSLQRNSWTGVLPEELGNLKELTYLGITSDYFDAQPFPDWLCTLTKLEDIRMVCNFTGNLPAEMANLFNLRLISIGDNQLTGSIPSEWERLTNLTNLALINNQLSGEFPMAVTKMQLLRNLNISGNQFTGSIPIELMNLVYLEELHLNGNQFTGTIPSELGDLLQLKYLNLSDNQLTGSIPPELGNLTQLEDLDLSSNQFTGSVPEELTRLPNWGTTITPEEDIFPQQGGNLEMEQPGDGEGGIHMDLEDKPVTDGETIDVDGTI